MIKNCGESKGSEIVIYKGKLEERVEIGADIIKRCLLDT